VNRASRVGFALLLIAAAFTSRNAPADAEVKTSAGTNAADSQVSRQIDVMVRAL
jgi:hypothetical protein